MKRSRRSVVTLIALTAALGVGLAALSACDGGGSKTVEVLFSAQANELDLYDLRTDEMTVLIPAERKNVNGQACLLPDGDGKFLMGEDTGQRDGARQGWMIFSADGQPGTKIEEPEAANEPDQIEPYGCAFDKEKRLFTSDIGDTDFDSQNGKLIVFFPSDYQASCLLDTTIRVAGAVAIDEDGSVLLTESVPPGRVLRFSGPFPNDAGECDTVKPAKETFIEDPEVGTPLGIARAPGGGWYISSVFVPPAIREYDHGGTFVRVIAEGDDIGNPAGIAVAEDGTIYYADLGLTVSETGIGPESGKGTVRKITFDADGDPQAPVIIGSNLDYPDAVSILERPAP
jgi:sugar lactone lactonase YvrE